MKSKIFIGFFVALMLLSVGVVSAIDVRCNVGRYNSDVCRDFELQDEFDYVEDYLDSLDTALSINGYHDNKQDKQIKKLKKGVVNNADDIISLEDSITFNAVLWSKDSSGVSFGRVKTYLYEDYFVTLNDYFVLKADYDALEHRIDVLEAIIISIGYDVSDYDYQGAMVRSKRLGEAVEYNNKTCVNGICI